MILRARHVLPISRPPIENGAVRIEGRRIADFGAWGDIQTQAGEETVDLGEVALLPGLINAHCHLDYTGLAGFIPVARSFPDWIKALLALKAEWSYTEYANSWVAGAAMLLQHGVTTVADIEAVPELLPEVYDSTPLRMCSLLEMTGVKSRRPSAEVLQEALRKIDSLPESFPSPGLSPHAPYSTSPELLRLSAALARERGWPMAVYVAESQAEFDMYMHASGALFDWLKAQRNMDDCGKGSPVQHLFREGVLRDNLLAIHVNYLAPGDAELLGQGRVSVVHCPRSHAYFKHAPFPRAALEAAGVNVCLGTDSLASVEQPRGKKVSLDMFAEMRALAAAALDLPAERILRMATLNGAQGLGLTGQIGEITKDALADLVAVPCASGVETIYETVLQHQGPVAAVMIDGQWVFPIPSSEMV